MYNRKKGVDKARGVCYTVQAVSERHSPSERKATARTLKTIQRMIEKFFGACEDRSEGRERVKGSERVRDPRTVRFEELNARLLKGKRVLWRVLGSRFNGMDKGLNIRV